MGGTLAQCGGCLGRGTCPSSGKRGEGYIFENNAPPSPPSPPSPHADWAFSSMQRVMANEGGVCRCGCKVRGTVVGFISEK